MVTLFVLTWLYVFLLLFLAFGILLNRKPDHQFIRKISVIIAARNEEKDIPHLLDALSKQDYPPDQFEVVLADDRSEDATYSIMQAFSEKFENFSCVRVTDSDEGFPGKKRALDKAIRHSSGDILAFTDADCRPGASWLSEVNGHFDMDKDFIAGYSPLITSSGKFIDGLKNLERASIFAVSAGSMGWNWGMTCTARNIAYTRKLYNEVEGFSGIDHILSGDDDLMLQKVSKSCTSKRFMFTQESIVPSYENDDLSVQFQREQRRASKFMSYSSSVKWVAILVLVYYFSMIVSLIPLACGYNSWALYFKLFGLKAASELLLLSIFLIRIKRIEYLRCFLPAEILYIPYFIYFGIRGTLGKYRWR